MIFEWTAAQKQRLIELDAPLSEREQSFSGRQERDSHFQEIETHLVTENRARLEQFRLKEKEPALLRLERKLAAALVRNDFIRVSTPAILAGGLLERMSINNTHPLYKKVFWLDGNKCLRPMLAPSLYYILKDLLRLWPHPVRIFEIGSCYRKESEGAHHLNEFTMLNLVEMGSFKTNKAARLAELGRVVLSEAGITDYRIETAESDLYGETVDFVSGFELGSGAFGPHPLDEAWEIAADWVGIGFGLERLLMAGLNSPNIKRVGRSLSYLGGVRLNL